MNRWTQEEKGGKRGKSRFFIILFFCLVMLIAIIIAFFIAVQLTFFPFGNKTASSEELVLESPRNLIIESPIASPHNTDITYVRDPFISSGKHIQKSPENKLKNTTKLTSHLKKNNSASGEVRQIRQSSDVKVKTPVNNNVDLEKPPQEIKLSMVLPTLGINNELTVSKEASVAVITTNPAIMTPITKIQYSAKKNESANAIAGKFGVTPDSICQENRLIEAMEKLPEGKTLSIPIPGNHFYRLKLKETLWRLAQRYGTTVAVLQEINNISDITKIKAGDLIVLPVPVDKIANSKF